MIILICTLQIVADDWLSDWWTDWDRVSEDVCEWQHTSLHPRSTCWVCQTITVTDHRLSPCDMNIHFPYRYRSGFHLYTAVLENNKLKSSNEKLNKKLNYITAQLFKRIFLKEWVFYQRVKMLHQYLFNNVLPKISTLMLYKALWILINFTE